MNGFSCFKLCGWFLWLSKHPRAFLDKQGLNPKSFEKEKGPEKNNLTRIFTSCCNSSLCSHWQVTQGLLPKTP